MDLGIFIPIGNNGWMMSENAPQYMPSFALNRKVAAKAEEHGFEFLLSMVKLRGFGGSTEFWDHNLESFTLMAGLAAVTSKIKLYASVALPTLNPAMVAMLHAKGVDTVILAGVSTSGCIRASATDAMQNGFVPIVVRDAVGDRNPGPHEARSKSVV